MALDDNSIITFGEHRGEKLANVPASYMIWLGKQSWCSKDLKDYINENMDVLQAECKPSESRFYDN